jgi:hypothetical protein
MHCNGSNYELQYRRSGHGGRILMDGDRMLELINGVIIAQFDWLLLAKNLAGEKHRC